MGRDIPVLYHKANVGRRVAASASAVPGGFSLLETSLITARWEEAEQWIVTLMPPVNANGVIPWVSTFDGGTAYPPVAPAIFTAPPMPGAGFPRRDPKCRLRWGAGGTAFETKFDYPQHGAIFGVTADTFDLAVEFNPAVVASVPDIGAFMVPGVAADPTPLHWLEGLQGFAVFPALGSDRFWAVKPWARTVRISLNTLAPGISEFTFTFLDTAGVGAYFATLTVPLGHTGATFEFEVPAVATVLALRNIGPAITNVAIDWQIGLT